MHKNPTAAEIILREDLEKKWTKNAVHSEFRFLKNRKYLFDFAVPLLRIAFEINGGIFIKGKTGAGGAHSLPTNILRDMEKKNLAAVEGWRVFEFTPKQIECGEHLAFLKLL